MCHKENFTQHKKCVAIFKVLMKIFIQIIYKLFNMRLCELLWFSIILLTLVIIWTKNSDKKMEQDDSSYPVIMWWTPGFPETSETRICSENLKCDVFTSQINSDVIHIDSYLFYASNIDFDNLPLPRRPRDIIWGLYHEESPRNVVELMYDEILSLFNFSSTFSRYSDVPFPLQFLESIQDITSTKYYVTIMEKNMISNISPVMYLQSDCETSTERDMYVKELMQYIDVDSYGACLNNKQMPHKFLDDYLNKLNDDDFLHFIARYKFVIAIENGACEDYVTEKFWRAIKVGSVPIYFGSPTIRDWFPNNKSAILLQDYPTPKLLSDYIKKLLNDDKLYESHLIHKTRQIITNEKLMSELKIRDYQSDALKVVEKFECHICEAIYNKRKGSNLSNMVNKKHYNCPEPISALELNVNTENDWVYSYRSAKVNVLNIYKRITGPN